VTTSAVDDMLAHIRDLADTLPTRCPTILRVGPGVVEELNGGKPIKRPLFEPPLPLGVDIIQDAGYGPGQWLIEDQWGDEISAGVLPVPAATVEVPFVGGGAKKMRVLTVTRDDAGRIISYTAADAAMLDDPFAVRWGVI
jgi:hypothetical protein